MKKLLLLLPLLLMLPASAQTLAKKQAAELRAQICQQVRNAAAANQTNDLQKVCTALQKQNEILETAMAALQLHFPETDWKQLRRVNTRMMNQEYCFAGGILMP